MAVRAIILIEAQVGWSKEVLEHLRSLPGVETADAVTGPYDIIASVTAADLAALADYVTNRIHSVPGIARVIVTISMSDS